MSFEKWTPVIIKHHGEAFEKDVYEKYEVSDRCRIRNVKTKKILSSNYERVELHGMGIPKKIRRHRVCLASFYPDEIPEDISKYDVDHIDGNHDNNVLSNLQWLTKYEHALKTHKQTKGKRKSAGNLQGKKVKIIEVKGNGNINFLGKIFESCNDAARELNIKIKSIGTYAKNGIWVSGKYRFKFIAQELLDGEIFKSVGNCEISNKGRFKNSHGKITKGTNKINFKYRTASILIDNIRKKYYIHTLVWMAFNGPIPEGKVIMHNDTYNTLDEEGYERNWLEDLSLGTQKENMQSYHDNRNDLKRVRCVDTGEEFSSIGHVSKALNLNSGSIHRVCNKKRKTAGGFKFEYIN